MPNSTIKSLTVDGVTYDIVDKRSGYITGITSSDVTTALGFTPYSAANPNGYTSNTGTVTGVKVNGTTNNPTNGVVDIGTVLTSYTETDPVFTASVAHGITSTDITNWNNKLDSYTETDPTVPSWAKASSKPSYNFSEIGSTPTTLSGYGITNAYTKTEVDGLVSGVLHYKGTKATVANLPSTGNTIGDVWHVTADGSEWAWDGTNWQELGTAVDLSNYVTTDDSRLSDARTPLAHNQALSTITGADDLQAIEALSGTSGFLKKTAANTWTLDTNTYALASAIPSNIVNTITTTAGAHTAITSATGNVSFNVPTTAAHVGIKFGYTTSGNNRAVQQDSSGNLYVVQKDDNDNTNYYHTTGSWSGLTYTATANGGAGALAFTIPTGTTATTVAVGNHSHGNITNGGDITATAPTIASGDQLVINDHSASKITNGPTFDGSTTTTALTPKGTWETFSKFSGSYNDLSDKPTFVSDVTVGGTSVVTNGVAAITSPVQIVRW